MTGVSVPVFCAMIKACEKQHGPKMGGAQLEEFRRLLAEAETIYMTLPDFFEQPQQRRDNKR